MKSEELVAKSLPGVRHAISAVPDMGWPAEGVVIWPEGGGVGIRCFHNYQDMAEAPFGCTTCGWGSQPWQKWVSLAKRIIAADDAMRATVS